MEAERVKAKQKLPPITDRQAEILLFIADHIEDDILDRSPSLERIGVAFGFSKTNAFRIVECLKEASCLLGATGLPGGLELTEQGDIICSRLRKNAEQDS